MLTGGLTDSQFVSNEGNVTHLGTKRRIAPVNAYSRGDFLTHQDGPRHIPHNSVGNQLSNSHSFKRLATAMDNTSDSQQCYQRERFKRKELESTLRSEQSILRSQRSGFNLITGETVGAGPKTVNPHSRYIASGLGPESHHRGLRMMADSSNRYFTPHFSGSGQRVRQGILQSEGLSHPKMAGVINIGKAEIPSNGLEDQFSRSQYFERPRPLTGLLEKGAPGKYTPRNQPNNPSGNPQV
jgi:hypothetical protein